MLNRLTNVRYGAVIFLLSTVSCIASEYKTPKRISGNIMDLGEVQAIYMVPGMATIIEIPSKVTDVISGDVESVKFLPLGNAQNEVRLALTTNRARPTNLIIRSGSKKYVFDIVPSKAIHQDTIKVMSSYGGPELDSSKLTLIATSGDQDNKMEKKK